MREEIHEKEKPPSQKIDELRENVNKENFLGKTYETSCY